MKASQSFTSEGHLMVKTATLFEKCPLCGEGTINTVTRKMFIVSRLKIQACPVCSAEFDAKGEDNYQLLYCEPRKVIGRKAHGQRGCRERIYRGCYLGATLHRSGWKKIAEGGEAQFFERFLEMNQKYLQGLLPTYPSDAVPFPLETGEVVHYVSSPVYMDEAQPSHGERADKGDFILTNKRIIYARKPETVIIPIEKIERIEETPPGFLIKEKDSYEPLYFFPPHYDPIFAAVKGAIRNFRKG
ncbi:MAG: hypothetical protein ACE5HG_00660 [Candidatus Bathyarchaeia archaeon]